MTKQILSNCSLVELAVKGDDRGSLVAIEGRHDVPFDIARVYYVFDTRAGIARGFHAHLDLQQLAICVSGSCVMVLDDGRERVDVPLASPSVGLLIGPMIWREMRDFSPDCVLIVLASARYEESDYIRDYGEFFATARGGAGK